MLGGIQTSYQKSRYRRYDAANKQRCARHALTSDVVLEQYYSQAGGQIHNARKGEQLKWGYTHALHVATEYVKGDGDDHAAQKWNKCYRIVGRRRAGNLRLYKQYDGEFAQSRCP